MRGLRFAVVVAVAALMAFPAAAAVTPCTPGMVSANLCNSTDDVLIHYAIPPGAQADFVEAWGDEANYQGTRPCADSLQRDEHGLVLQLGPGDGDCTEALAGTEVPNPQTRAAAVDAYIRHRLASQVKQYRMEKRVEAERAAAEAEELTPPLGQ